MLIPAFSLMGTGIAQYIRVKEREKRASIAGAAGCEEPFQSRARNPDELIAPAPSVTEGTTVIWELRRPRGISEPSKLSTASTQRRKDAENVAICALREVNQTARVCVPVCEKDLDALRSACERAIEWADIIELRLDCLDQELAEISELLTTFPSSGHSHLSSGRTRRLSQPHARGTRAFWKMQAPRGEGLWWDVEATSPSDLAPDWSRTIVSHHDFNGVPDDLDQIYERLGPNACSRSEDRCSGATTSWIVFPFFNCSIAPAAKTAKSSQSRWATQESRRVFSDLHADRF